MHRTPALARWGRITLLAIQLAVLVLFAALPARAEKVALLHKSRDPNHATHTAYIGNFIRKAGFDYDLMDVEKLLVDPISLKGYSGVVTAYLSSQMLGAELYPAWLLEQMDAGRRVVIIGSYGAYQGLLPNPGGGFTEWNESTKEINTFFWPFGLEFYLGFTGDPAVLKATRKVERFSEFETPLAAEDLKYYQLFRSVNSRNRVHLEVRRSDMVESESAFVVHTPFGGMVLESYGFFWSPEQKKMVERVDMASFIGEALQGPVGPVPRYDIPGHAELVSRNPLPERSPPNPRVALHPSEPSRHVLVPYKSSEMPSPELHPIYDRAGMVLNHLGMIPEYWAVDERGLPSDDEMTRYRAIITWDETPFLAGARGYGEWLLRQVREGKRLVIMQTYGASVDPETQERPGLEAAIFAELGIQRAPLRPVRIDKLPRLRVADPLLGFEHPVDAEQLSYQFSYRSTGPGNRVHLSLSDPNHGPIDLVVTGPLGGVAMGDSAFASPSDESGMRALVEKAIRGEIPTELAQQSTVGTWRLDPYQFFTRALGLEGLPVPDFTTINGARIAYSHIDGDGLESVSLIDRAHSAGFYVKRDLLERYDDLPHTVSVISKAVEESGNRTYHPMLELAREMFRLPQVEVATHTATHPFNWVRGDPFIANPEKYPYEIVHQPYNLLEEIWGTRLFIERNLSPAGKNCEVLLWSGATNPDKAALEIVWRSGMENLNGGDPIFDAEHPSVAGLAPLSRLKGPYRQYLTSAANDFVYTLFMTGDWSGQRKVLDHFARTGQPRRVLPMNVYYHFYAGIKQASLGALREVFDDLRAGARAGEVAPIFSSDYCRIARDYFQTRVMADGDGGWLVENGGKLRTLRFPSPVHVDLDRSKGVLGYLWLQGQTYVHLDGSRLRHVVLGDRSPSKLFLRKGTMSARSVTRHDGGMLLGIRGFGWAVFELAGARPGSQYRIRLEGPDGEVPLEESLRASPRGTLQLRELLPAPARDYLLRVEPADDRDA